MKIAIIDDGVHAREVGLPITTIPYLVSSNGQVKERQDSQFDLTHGTICASIICQINPSRDIEIVDLKIFTKKRASVDALITALAWCYDNSIKLVNMSLGSINYHDYFKLSDIVNKLLSIDSILVSAYHNTNIVSYPAAFPEVFGVRSDKSKILGEKEYALDLCPGFSPESCFVANFLENLQISPNRCVSTEMQNSFASPVITGHISKYLVEEPMATPSQVLRFLQNNAKQYTATSNKICHYINARKWPIKSVIIGARISDNSILLQLHAIFERNGYNVESFCDDKKRISDEWGIPLSYYCNQKQCVDKNILYTLDYIYKTDVIIIDQASEDFNVDWTLWDALILEENNKLVLKTEVSYIQCDCVDDLYSSILNCFDT